MGGRAPKEGEGSPIPSEFMIIIFSQCESFTKKNGWSLKINVTLIPLFFLAGKAYLEGMCDQPTLKDQISNIEFMWYLSTFKSLKEFEYRNA